jgi:hypothetical protein
MDLLRRRKERLDGPDTNESALVPSLSLLEIDTGADLVLRNVSAGNPRCRVCSDRRRSDCAPSALGHVFNAALVDLDRAAKSGCSLCAILHSGALHFKNIFMPGVSPSAVHIQYSENLAQASYLPVRDSPARTYCEISLSFDFVNLAPIQLLLSPQGITTIERI